MDDSLIAEAVSAISAPPVLPRFVGSASPQTSSAVAHVPASLVFPTKGFLRKGFLRLSSSIVIRGYSPEPVQPTQKSLGLVCPHS
jgi:hypothetical protein